MAAQRVLSALKAWANETIYFHLFATQNESCCDVFEMHSVHELTTYKQLPRGKKGRSLLEDEAEGGIV